MKNPLLKAYIAWAMVCIFWGATYLAIRVSVATFPTALFAGIRFTIAGLAFLLFLRLRGYTFPPWREVADQAVVGMWASPCWWRPMARWCCVSSGFQVTSRHSSWPRCHSGWRDLTPCCPPATA